MTESQGLPAILGFLAPQRRRALRRAYADGRAAGRDEAVVIAELALQHGLAPSFVRILLDRPAADDAD